MGQGAVASLTSHGQLVFERTLELSATFDLALDVPGELSRTLDDGGFVFQAQRRSRADFSESIAELQRLGKGGGSFESAQAVFDLGAFQISPNRLRLRNRSPGDRMRVFGRGARDVKKLFQERGVRLTLRDRIPIVELGSEILWIPGVARSEIAPISETTEEFLVLSYSLNH